MGCSSSNLDTLLSPDSLINSWEFIQGFEGENDFDLHFGKSFNLDSFNFRYLIDDPEKPRSKFGINLIDSCENLKNLCDDTQKKLGFDLIDSCGDLKNLGDFSDTQKKLGFDLNDYEKNLCDSFVFVEMPRGVVEGGELLSARKSEPKRVSESVVSDLVDDDDCKVVNFEEKIVLYFTSLRGIRKTYEDCCAARLILGGFRVMVDEKDISMDSNYRKELQSLLDGKAMSLPQLFIGGRHIGGVDEIKHLHDIGELERLLVGFPVLDHGLQCHRCCETRFVPCLNCYGSGKVFDEAEGETRKCSDCNENGLVRCPGCCS